MSFGSSGSERGSSTAQPEPSCGDQTWDAGPEPEPESQVGNTVQPEVAASVAHGARVTAAGDTTAAQEPAQAAQEPAQAVHADAPAGIPVPNITDEPQKPSGVYIPTRPVIIVGRSLCDVNSDEAVGHAQRDSLPAQMGETPPLLSMIRQTVMTRKQDPR